MDWIYKIQRHACLTSSEIRAIALISFILMLGSLSSILPARAYNPRETLAVKSQDYRSNLYVGVEGQADTLKKVNKNRSQVLSDQDSTNTVTKREKIDLNSAGLSQLISLKGIGPSLAKRIIDYRKRNGPFLSIEDITRVKGIGKAKLKAIREEVSIGGAIN